MIKAIFFDIDGTLVSFKTHRMSGNLRKRLHELQANGVKLFVSTGRSRLIINNLDDFPFDGYVAMNGAETTLGGEVIDSHPLPKAAAARVADLAAECKVPCWIFGETAAGLNFENDRTREVSASLQLFPNRFYDFHKVIEDQKVYEYTIYFTEEEERKYLYPVIEGTCYTRWHPYFLDIVPEGLSKSYGASRILERLGISREECMAFGDGGNDIPIIEYAGTGVAMGNATPDVKSVADYVTDSVDEDGVVTALQHFGVL